MPAVGALLVSRALVLWLVTRALYAVAALTSVTSVPRDAPGAGRALLPEPAVATALVGLSVLLGLLDGARRHERALLGNFGVSRWQQVAWLALPAALGELLVATAAAVAR